MEPVDDVAKEVVKLMLLPPRWRDPEGSSWSAGPCPCADKQFSLKAIFQHPHLNLYITLGITIGKKNHLRVLFLHQRLIASSEWNLDIYLQKCPKHGGLIRRAYWRAQRLSRLISEMTNLMTLQVHMSYTQ